MRRSFAIVAVSALMLSTLPMAFAGYMGFGESEPNTIYDAAPYNIYTPDVSTLGATLYFNAFITFSATTFNPNVGLLDTSVYTPVNHNYEAFLGVWKDCNADGYMGHAESALFEYRSELLLDDSICPDDSPHNRGSWVTEMIYVGRLDECRLATDEERADPEHDCANYTSDWVKNDRVVYTNATRIWGDDAAPGEAVGGSSCPLGLLPEGTTANTGMTLRYFDCFIGFKIGQTLTQTDDVHGLGFTDPKNPQLDQDHPLVFNLPVHPFRNPFDADKTGVLQAESDDPAFHTWDCSGDTAAQDTPAVKDETGLLPADVDDPLGDEGDKITITDEDGNLLSEGTIFVKTPAPSLGNPIGSYYDALLGVYDGFGWTASSPMDMTVLGFEPEFGPDSYADGDCDPKTRNYLWMGDLSPEGHNEPQTSVRKENELTMQFWPASRAIVGIKAIDDPLGGEDTPGDLGITAARDLYGPTWYSPGYAATGQHVNRATLEPHSRQYYTWYAAVDQAELSAEGLAVQTLPDFTYGSEHCGSNIGSGAEPAKGFACDPDVWYIDTAGQDTMPRYRDDAPYGGIVGDSYQMRDSDCYDGRIIGGTLYVSLTQHSAKGTCADDDGQH